MTDKKDDTQSGLSGKKPAAILDLKATVVETVKVSQPSVETRAAFAGTGAKTNVGVQTAASVPSSKPADVKAADTASAAKSAAQTNAKPADPKAAPGTVSVSAKPTSRGGMMSHLLSGVAGGALALFAMTQLAPLLNIGDYANSGGLSTANERIGALEKLAKAAPADAVQARIAKLEEAAQTLTTGQVNIAAEAKTLSDKIGKVPALPEGAGEKLARLEEQLSQMVAAANADPTRAGRLPQLAQLTSKIGEVETALATRTAQLKSELMQQMDQRFAKTGETVETTRSTMSQRAQSVEQSVKLVTDETAALRAGVDAVKLDLDKRFREAAKPADVQSAVASVATKVSTLEQSMQGVVKSEQERNQTAGNILLSLELANLKRALDRGGKYSSELAAVRGLAGPKLDFAVLEAQQATGVPSLATLGQELAQTAHAMLDAEAEPADASIADRLLSGVKSIVRVRKVDFAPGDQSTEALIARMEQALKEGRVADVLEESKKLTPKAAAPAAKWLDRIKSRAAIDTALASLDASLKTSLAGGAAPKKVSN